LRLQQALSSESSPAATRVLHDVGVLDFERIADGLALIHSVASEELAMQAEPKVLTWLLQ